MHATLPLSEVTDFPDIYRDAANTLQVNLGYRCNQRCLHCHVNASPDRTEMMGEENLRLIIPVMKARGMTTLDLTGGAPEMHDHFRKLVSDAYQAGIHVIDRCNLTILSEPGQESLAEFLAEHRVEIVASLPCYSVANVDQQRGKGVFDRSISGLQRLNELGYGRNDSGLTLNLVYNPQGPSLPPDQLALENDYKRELKEHFDIDFNHLFALANMPIKRFGSTLISKGQFQPYMELLKKNHLDANLPGVMCRHLVSVDWQGNLYDCDFNQQLSITMPGQARHLMDLLNTHIDGQAIAVAEHCYACTAGQGSSCGGAL